MNQNRKWAYWAAQAMGWGLYLVFLLLMIFSFRTPDDHLGRIVSLQMVIAFCGLLASHGLRRLYKKRSWTTISPGRALPKVLGSALAAAIFAQAGIHLAMLTILNWEVVAPIDWSMFPVYTFNLYLVLLLWSLFYFGFHYYERGQRLEVEKFKTQAALREAELIALKAQINPHFLFNALNNIRALILEDAARSREMVTYLSDLLRYSIRFQDNEEVALSTELTIVEQYLQLESIQYEDRLHYVLDIDPQTLEQCIPPMTVQLLVENAVKHGIAQLPAGGQIRVHTRLEGDQLQISVENTGHLAETNSSGIGIQNILERVRLLFNGEPKFTLEEADGRVLANLQLPVS